MQINDVDKGMMSEVSQCLSLGILFKALLSLHPLQLRTHSGASPHFAFYFFEVNLELLMQREAAHAAGFGTATAYEFRHDPA